MSFFDSVKKSLGMSKEKVNDNGQGRSGYNYDQFEVTFVEEKLGIGISKYTGDMPHLGALSSSKEERSCPVVTNCETRAYDVKPGDLIVALEGNPISSFDDFTSIIKAIGRPVKIRYSFLGDFAIDNLLTSNVCNEYYSVDFCGVTIKNNFLRLLERIKPQQSIKTLIPAWAAA